MVLIRFCHTGECVTLEPSKHQIYAFASRTRVDQKKKNRKWGEKLDKAVEAANAPPTEEETKMIREVEAAPGVYEESFFRVPLTLSGSAVESFSGASETEILRVFLVFASSD